MRELGLVVFTVLLMSLLFGVTLNEAVELAIFFVGMLACWGLCLYLSLVFT